MRSAKQRRKWEFRYISSKYVLLMYFWLFATLFSLRLKELVVYFNEVREKTYSDDHYFPSWIQYLNIFLYHTVYSVACPLGSLIAELYTGRLRLIRYCLRAIWILKIVASVISVTIYFHHILRHEHWFIMITLYTVDTPTVVLQGIFQAVIIPLTLDQISGAPNTSISAVIMWSIWTQFSAFAAAEILLATLNNCVALNVSEIDMIVSVIPVMLFSVAIILDVIFHHKLIQEPVTANPVKLIFKVMKYAAQHKYPVQRSAFTYCENEKPTRLDNGKSKYGGPFTTEQVEDVKTFWRILLVIAVISLFHAPLNAVRETYYHIYNTFQPTTLTHCAKNVISGVIKYPSIVVIAVPLYEFLIYPLLRNHRQGILHSARVGAGALLVSSLYGIIVDGLRQTKSDVAVSCLFNSSHNDQLILSPIPVFVVPFSSILGIAIMLIGKTTLEFICAQAPYNMTGFFIGLELALQLLLRGVGKSLIYNSIWNDDSIPELQTGLCGTWFYLTNLVLGLVLAVLLYVVTKRYKTRERDETVGSQMLVEEVYYKYNRREQENGCHTIQ